MSEPARTDAAPTAAAGDADPRAADGRVPGRRGLATRQRLLHCTRAMVEATAYRDVRVVDIAREAGTSPATFYQYFPDVEAAVLVLAEEMASQGGARFTELASGRRWRGKQGYATAEALVDGFMAFWEEHRPVIRVVDLATDEGDLRFQDIRTKLLRPLTVALHDVIAAEAADGRHPSDLDPMASAGVLVAMLAQVAAHRYGFEFWGIRTDDVRRSLARILYTTVTGQKPPA